MTHAHKTLYSLHTCLGGRGPVSLVSFKDFRKLFGVVGFLSLGASLQDGMFCVPLEHSAVSLSYEHPVSY